MNKSNRISKKKNSKKIMAHAHRGASGYLPENTIASFQKAVELKSDYIELDVHLSKDNRLIVNHDYDLKRVTGIKGKISKLTFEQIKNYRTKNMNQKIPTLKEVIQKFKGKIKFNIEVKGYKPAEKVCNLIKKYKIEKDVLISSANKKGLLKVKECLPNIKTALIYHATRTTKGEYIFVLLSMLFYPITKKHIVIRAKNCKVDYIHLVYPFASKKFVKKLHELGYYVNVWIVNSKKQIDKMTKVGVDGVITNYPDNVETK